MGLINRERRAKAKAARETRRQQIVEAAAEVFEKLPWSSIELDTIARKIGLPAGTPSLYFGGKEELCLHLLEIEAERWFSAFDTALENGPLADASVGTDAIASWMADDLAQRLLLVRLFALQIHTLEHNMDVEPAAQSYARLQTSLRRSGALLEARAGLEEGQGALAIRRFWTAAAGMHPLAHGGNVFWGIARVRKLTVFQLDLREELEVFARALLR